MFKLWITDLMDVGTYLDFKCVRGMTAHTHLFKSKVSTNVKHTKFAYVSWEGYLRDVFLVGDLKY